MAQNVQEGQLDNTGAPSEEHDQQQRQHKQKEQVQKILANVRQNFGKISVAPEFTEEDLVPLEMPDLEIDDISGSEDGSEEEDEEEEDETNAEAGNGETEETTAAQSEEANGNKSSKEVIRELDAKIASTSSSWTGPNPSASLKSGMSAQTQIQE